MKKSKFQFASKVTLAELKRNRYKRQEYSLVCF